MSKVFSSADDILLLLGISLRVLVNSNYYFLLMERANK